MVPEGAYVIRLGVLDAAAALVLLDQVGRAVSRWNLDHLQIAEARPFSKNPRPETCMDVGDLVG